MKKGDYKDLDIFILNYLNDNYELRNGKIETNNLYYFHHNIDVNNDLLGSPIFSTNTLKVIGIQKKIKKNYLTKKKKKKNMVHSLQKYSMILYLIKS